MKASGYIGIALIALTISGCSALDNVLQSVGLGRGASNHVEAFLAAQVAGTYEVKISKDGAALLTETWTCTKDETTGKLTGCHKQ